MSIAAMEVKYRDYLTVCHELCRNGRTNRDAVWVTESGRSREHVYMGCSCPTRRDIFRVSGLLKKMVKRGGWIKG